MSRRSLRKQPRRGRSKSHHCCPYFSSTNVPAAYAWGSSKVYFSTTQTHQKCEKDGLKFRHLDAVFVNMQFKPDLCHTLIRRAPGVPYHPSTRRIKAFAPKSPTTTSLVRLPSLNPYSFVCRHPVSVDFWCGANQFHILISWVSQLGSIRGCPK